MGNRSVHSTHRLQFNSKIICTVVCGRSWSKVDDTIVDINYSCYFYFIFYYDIVRDISVDVKLEVICIHCFVYVYY